MDQKTLIALQQSIAKWEANAKVEDWRDAHVFGDTCALCDLFCPNPNEMDACLGCPVSERTGQDNCGGSPWDRAYISYINWRDFIGSAVNFQMRAQAEVDFLKSLLPKDDGHE